MHEILTSYMVVKSNAGTRNGKDKGLVCILIPKGSYATLSASPSFLDILAFCSSDMSFSSTMASNNWREKSNQISYIIKDWVSTVINKINFPMKLAKTRPELASERLDTPLQ